MAVKKELKLDARRKCILDILNREGKIRVEKLGRQLNVSQVTIRNDLAELERNGYLSRVPGGAVQTMNNYYNLDFQQRKSEHAAEKQAIAAAAAELISDGETLMINSGTTTFFTAIELKRYKNLKIVTNSISIAVEMGGLPNAKVILLGGEVNSQYSFTYGDDALMQLQKYKADKLILSVDGVRHDAGLTSYHAEEREINRLMIERSSSRIVVADFTKIGYESFSQLGAMDSIDYLVTNKGADVQRLSEIEACGVQIKLC